MPNWKIHLEVGKRLNKKLNFSNSKLIEFMIGNILPDINNAHMVKDISEIINHNITHYDDLNIPSYENFYNKYNKLLFKEPIILGYYVHLCTDYIWNNDFYTKIKNNKLYNNYSSNELRIKKHNDFKCYNNKFIDNKIFVTNYEEIINKCKIIDNIKLEENDIKKAVKYIDELQKNDLSYEFYTESDLDLLLEKSIKIISEKLDNLSN